MCPKMAHYQTPLPSAERVVRDRELALIGARKPFLSRRFLFVGFKPTPAL